MKFVRLLGCGLVLVVAQGFAQTESDPYAEDPYAEEETSAEETAAPVARFYGDFTLRHDHVGSLNPLARRKRIERERARLRFGWRGTHENIEWAIAAKLARGTDSNRDTLANLDNEKTDSQGLDELMLRWNFNESTQLLLGKTHLPIDLTPMVWDSDFRPAGISLSKSFSVNEFDRVSLVGGYFAPMHLFEDDSRLGAFQVGYHWREGAPFSGSVKLGYLHFSDLEGLVESGLARSNWRHIVRAPGAPPPTGCSQCHGVTGPLVNDFHIADLQGELRWTLADKPLVANLNLVKNLGASQDDEGARVSVTYGSARVPRQFEYGLAYQRFQRDAVLAAFSEDDWWFHSNARGALAHIGYGVDETWSVHLTYVKDRRDGPFRNGPVERFLFDIKAFW